MENPQPYKEVRALKRALELINALGEIGWAGPTTLAEHTGINRSTIYRLMTTLVEAGFVVRREQDSKYYLSSHLWSLCKGMRDEDALSLLTSGPLTRLTQTIKWPSDFAILEAGRLVIVNSTHPHTTMTFYRSVISQSRPILRSALGKAIIAAMSPEDRADTIKMILSSDSPDASDFRDPKLLENIIEDVRVRGYALSTSEAAEGIKAIALPIKVDGKVYGAVNIVIFRSAFKLQQVEAEFLEPLRKCVEEIETAFRRTASVHGHNSEQS